VVCCITLQPVVDGVLGSDGNIYEKTAIETWLKTKQVSPLTNLPMSKTLYPINCLKSGFQVPKVSVTVFDGYFDQWLLRNNFLLSHQVISDFHRNQQVSTNLTLEFMKVGEFFISVETLMTKHGTASDMTYGPLAVVISTRQHHTRQATDGSRPSTRVITHVFVRKTVLLSEEEHNAFQNPYLLRQHMTTATGQAALKRNLKTWVDFLQRHTGCAHRKMHINTQIPCTSFIPKGGDAFCLQCQLRRSAQRDEIIVVE